MAAESLKLRVLDHDTLVREIALTAPLELGRQRVGEPEPPSLIPATGTPTRLILARQQEGNVSRQHLRLEPLASGAVRVSNSSQIPLPISGIGVAAVPPGVSLDLMPPFSLALPPRTLTLALDSTSDDYGVQGLDEQTVAPGSFSSLSQRFRPLPALGLAQVNDLVGWLQTSMGVLQSAVGSTDFLKKATTALVDIVGLHSGRVLLLEQDRWRIVAEHGVKAADADEWQPSRHVLDRVRQEKRTFWQHPRQVGTGDTPSLRLLHTVVAAPILDAEGAVIGALYGERRHDGTSPPTSGKVEAVLVDLLACGVATGLARQKHEEVARSARVRFEQFFTPELAQKLAEEPDLLEGREADVTLLFADVRGFSRISEKLGPARTVAWISDVMGELSACVLAEEGVLVDYIGDELIAMWGAPQSQPDQVARAVRAALAMRTALHVLDERWRDTIGEPLNVGIGLNTGPAHVGNTGSKFKFKYGPLGNTVNLASRIQGLTRYLRCPLLVSASTRKQLDDRVLVRRVCRARVVNIAQPVDLYEVEAAGDEGRREFFRESERALEALEAGDFPQAARAAGALLLDHRGDGPMLLVLSRATTMLVQDDNVFDPVWEPPGK